MSKEKPTEKCYLCGGPAYTEDMCYGCGQIICFKHEPDEEPIEQHDPEAHEEVEVNEDE